VARARGRGARPRRAPARAPPPPGAFDACLLLAAPSADPAPHLAEDLGLLAERLPGVPVVVVGGDAGDPALAALAARHGARGLLPTGAPLRLLAQGIRFVLLGGTALPAAAPAAAPPPRAAGAPAEAPAEAPAGEGWGTPWSGPGLLTPREAEVVRALAAGMPNKLIAHELAMCETTVKVHLRHVFRKLGCTNRTQAALLAREMLGEADAMAAAAAVPVAAGG
jgi:DNA-binding NarL/FixJ family response regulator